MDVLETHRMNPERLKDLASKANLEHANQLINSVDLRRFLAELVNLATQGKEINAKLPIIENEDVAQNFVKEAENLLTFGHQVEAELLLMGLAISSPTRRAAVEMLAALYESQSAYSLTISFAQQLLASGANDADVAYQLAFALFKTGRSDEALEYLLPYYICNPSHRTIRLCGLLLFSLNRPDEAINVLETAIQSNPKDYHSIRALAEIYIDLGMYQKSLEVIKTIPHDSSDVTTRIFEAYAYRYQGKVDDSIRLLSEIIASEACPVDALWTQCFNYSISSRRHAFDLLKTANQYWINSDFLVRESKPTAYLETSRTSYNQVRIGFLAADIGEHVVSRFLAPLLRSHDKAQFIVTLFSTARRFEQKSVEIASMADYSVTLHQLSLNDARSCIIEKGLDIIIDTNGFTRNSGLPILGKRCAPIQCHYIGYHATTGLETIDYFIGDSVTTPKDFQPQYSEALVQIPSLWLGYDPNIDFPVAISKTQRECPVFGAFSQITKMTDITLDYWGAAMQAVPESILVIKDRGVQCENSRSRIEKMLERHGVDPSRVYFFGPVGSHLDHLDSYNAIDIALDTTPWSGATTAFEALGMGVPLVAICGDTTSGRMSTSVVSAAGKSHWIAHSKEDFARIAAELAEDYQHLRESKASMQKEIRSGILFDEQRICRDFYATIEYLVKNHNHISTSQT